MAGDYSRKTFDKKKHFSAVQLQQGRVLLDADWNEQSKILQYRDHTKTKDVVGLCGVPKSENGFNISIIPGGTDLMIAPGKIYVDGLLCELEPGALPVTYLNQPHYPNPDDTFFQTSPPDSPPESPVSSPPASPLASGEPLDFLDGTYIVYLEAWQREINHIDDPGIKEVALGQADTTTRLQVVWQVKLLEVNPGPVTSIDCDTHFSQWEEKISPPSGKLNARTVPDTTPEDPCILPPSSGYRRLENQLYRVEIHKGGSRDIATFKWSRDNASVQSKITKIEGNIITVTDLGKDEILGFADGQWVEIIDEEVALHNASKSLFQIDSVTPETNEITLNNSADTFKDKKRLKLCRWDQTGTSAQADGIAMETGWIKLEDGLEIQFSDGGYLDGDYWLIPARTATGEIEWPPFKVPNLNPEAQSPKGIDHHFCKLAILEVTGGMALLTDCRKLFPSLTNLQAEDIKYDSADCGLGEVDNVQQAIDMLCAVQDLRDHNKHMHGYGVVCGLKVICAEDRTKVKVEKGYAIDCEGNVIQLRKGYVNTYNIVFEAANENLLDNNGDGKVCLHITGANDQGPVLVIEEFIKKDFWDEVLEGTLLKDFYDDCIQNLFDFLKKQFPFDFSDTAPVPVSQRRLTALINLFAQTVNSASGPYAFISGKEIKDRGEIDCKDEDAYGKYEDQILWCLYKELKQLLSSETFCAMFDGDSPFPSYAIDPGLETIFGPVIRIHDKLKLHPSGQYAYTSGLDNKLYVYDLKRKELIQALVFPASTNIIIQDFVIHSSGNMLYALGLLDDKDSIFAEAEINTNGKVTWGKTSVKCEGKFKSLAINDAGNIYTTKVTEGLFQVKGIGLDSFSIDKIFDFNATGMLKLSEEENKAFAGDNQTSTTESTTFTHITNIDLSSNTSVSYKFSGNDYSDDMALFGNILYITGFIETDPGQKVLGGYNLNTGNPAFTSIELEDSWMYRMTPVDTGEFGKYMLITLADKFKVVRVNLEDHSLDSEFRIPTQLFPMGIAVNQKNKKAYVVNTIVNTLTDISLEVAFDEVNRPNFVEEPPEIIASYRDGIIEAYHDLLSHFLQYLKDCFTDKFLVDCPECTKDDKVYLATVEIRNRKVYHINNFSKRSYVKTPELWEYWLSTVPILPLVKEGFKKFSGTIL